MRYLLTAATYLISLVLVGIAAFFVVMFLAGPHAGLLPGWLAALVLALGWLAVLVIPMLLARRAWQRWCSAHPPRKRLEIDALDRTPH